ncbi:ovochymase-1 [Protopterus annectens]|uniref:ovochymase-1 n=1 Tax=Protopterus annectens TaxID=7888 RepID=UPI001CFAB082|nr:ovochymase-1 [Protopterus annectens]
MLITLQTVKVRSIVLHEQFDHVTLDYDVALLRLQAPLNFNDYVRPVCLPELLNTLNPTKVCVATKWGSTKEGDVRVNRLQQTIAPVLNTSICERDFYSDHPGGITDQMVCAGLPTPDGRDSCQGDSGGPLVCMDDRNSGTFRIYGIASWGAGCFRPKKPGVYTRVRVIMNWILEEIEKRDSTNILVVSTPELLKRCAGVKLTKARGEIKSPGYPRKYPNNARCTWTIEAVEDSVIRLDFKTFRTEKTEVCIDHLFVYATQNNIQELTAHYCGETLPSSLKVVGSRVTLVFTSNDQVTFEGFWLTYHIHLPEFGSDGLLDNKRACQPFTLLRVGAGEIFSASYPDMYPVMLECVWTLYSVSGKRVQIEIEDFSTESVSGCTWDYLKIFDGASRTATLLGHFCGEKEPLSLWSSGSFLTLYFKTDGSVGSRGFRLIYNEISSKSTGSLITHLEPSMENENKIQYGVPQIQPHGIETDEQNGQVSVRIIGGKSTVPHSWPWLVSLQSRKGHYCCGSLISKFWVVTAAHCPLSYGDVVILGLNNLHSAVENRQAIAVGGIYPHKEYKGVHNDIMLVQLQYAAILDDTVIPVALPHPSEEMDLNASCVIAGWGFTNVYNRTLTPKLQQAVVCLMDLDSCQSFWGDINESVVCTKAAAASSCMGDSGGALVCRKNGVYYLTGIISRGFRSCLVDAPTVNTNVAYYRTWISSITEGSV